MAFRLNCQEDPELMFSVDPRDEARAKRVCASCPVREACRSYALETGQDYGVWGGTTADERRALRAAWLLRRQLVHA